MCTTHDTIRHVTFALESDGSACSHGTVSCPASIHVCVCVWTFAEQMLLLWWMRFIENWMRVFVAIRRSQFLHNRIPLEFIYRKRAYFIIRIHVNRQTIHTYTHTSTNRVVCPFDTQTQTQTKIWCVCTVTGGCYLNEHFSLPLQPNTSDIRFMFN